MAVDDTTICYGYTDSGKPIVAIQSDSLPNSRRIQLFDSVASQSANAYSPARSNNDLSQYLNSHSSCLLLQRCLLCKSDNDLADFKKKLQTKGYSIDFEYLVSTGWVSSIHSSNSSSMTFQPYSICEGFIDHQYGSYQYIQGQGYVMKPFYLMGQANRVIKSTYESLLEKDDFYSEQNLPLIETLISETNEQAPILSYAVSPICGFGSEAISPDAALGKLRRLLIETEQECESSEAVGFYVVATTANGAIIPELCMNAWSQFNKSQCRFDSINETIQFWLSRNMGRQLVQISMQGCIKLTFIACKRTPLLKKVFTKKELRNDLYKLVQNTSRFACVKQTQGMIIRRKRSRTGVYSTGQFFVTDTLRSVSELKGNNTGYELIRDIQVLIKADDTPDICNIQESKEQLTKLEQINNSGANATHEYL